MAILEYAKWGSVPSDEWRWPHFSPREMSCHGTGSLVVEDYFMDWLETLREKCGFPLIVSSGYRSPEYNAQISRTGLGGPHTTGLAADIRIYGPRCMRVIKYAFDMGVTGFGMKQHGPHEERFVHLDLIQPGGSHPREYPWSYE